MNQANPLIENPEVIINLAWIALAGLAITALSVTIILTVAFRKSENPASLFYELVKRADVLKMLTVFLVLLSVTVLAFFRVIDSSGAVGIFGGVLGYVLGGLKGDASTIASSGKTKASESNEEAEKHSDNPAT